VDKFKKRYARHTGINEASKAGKNGAESEAPAAE
jgi:hypothetical protein